MKNTWLAVNMILWAIALLGNKAAIAQQTAASGMSMSGRLNTQGNLFKVEISFEVDRLSRVSQPKGMVLAYRILGADSVYNATSDSIYLENESVMKVNNTFYYSFFIQPINPRFIRLALALEDRILNRTIRKAYNFETQLANVSFGLKNLTHPSTGNYVMAGDSILFVSTLEKPLYIYYFEHSFDPAPPPMVTDFRPSQAKLNVKQRIATQTNTSLVLSGEGLYFVQEDTTGNEGIGFRVFEDDFPKYKKVENLAESMVYISTNTEITSLATAIDKRPIFDNFWLNLGGTMTNAQRLIRLYFQRVAYANQNFTNYKAGWKTDQGMVHIVFGEPDNIIFSANAERWEYFTSSNNEKITFDFYKQKNTFSGIHYELSRNESFKKGWYEAVKSWREGEVRP